MDETTDGIRKPVLSVIELGLTVSSKDSHSSGLADGEIETPGGSSPHSFSAHLILDEWIDLYNARLRWLDALDGGPSIPPSRHL